MVLLGGRISVEAKEKNMKFPQNVVLPEDFADDNFDIGPKTIQKYILAISAASFVVWNGPMGKFEDETYREGTDRVYEAIVSSDAWKIAANRLNISIPKRAPGSSTLFLQAAAPCLNSCLEKFCLE